MPVPTTEWRLARESLRAGLEGPPPESDQGEMTIPNELWLEDNDALESPARR